MMRKAKANYCDVCRCGFDLIVIRTVIIETDGINSIQFSLRTQHAVFDLMTFSSIAAFSSFVQWQNAVFAVYLTFLQRNIGIKRSTNNKRTFTIDSVLILFSFQMKTDAKIAIAMSSFFFVPFFSEIRFLDNAVSILPYSDSIKNTTEPSSELTENASNHFIAFTKFFVVAELNNSKVEMSERHN